MSSIIFRFLLRIQFFWFPELELPAKLEPLDKCVLNLAAFGRARVSISSGPATLQLGVEFPLDLAIDLDLHGGAFCIGPYLSSYRSSYGRRLPPKLRNLQRLSSRPPKKHPSRESSESGLAAMSRNLSSNIRFSLTIHRKLGTLEFKAPSGSM